MAAPIGTVWGSEVLDDTNGFRIGLYPTVSSTATETVVEVQIWWWTKYWIKQTSGQKLRFNWNATSASTQIDCGAIETTGSSGAWKDTRQIMIGTVQTKTYTHTNAPQTIDIAASLTGLTAVAGTATVTTAVTIPAITVYTVSYNANGGTGAPAAQTKTHGVNLTLSSTKPTRTNYEFLGWAKSASGAVAYQPGGVYSDNAAVTLYAVWKLKSITVIYDANGGYGAPASQTSTSAFALSRVAPERDGYVFLGWSTMNRDTVGRYQLGQMWDKVGECTLYAVWQPFKAYRKTDGAWSECSIAVKKNGQWVSGNACAKKDDVWYNAYT